MPEDGGSEAHRETELHTIPAIRVRCNGIAGH